MNKKEIEELIKTFLTEHNKKIYDLESRVHVLESNEESEAFNREHPPGCQCTQGCA